MKNLNLIPKALVIAITFLLCFNDSFAQYQERSYDVKCGAVSGTDFGRSIINRLDRGYSIAGYSYNALCGIGPYDWMFVKLFQSGLPESARLIGTQGDDKCNSVIQTANDSGYTLAGYMYQAPGLQAATLVKMGKLSNFIYSKKIDDTVNSNYKQVVKDQSNRWGFVGMNERPYMGKRIPKILATQYLNGVKTWGFRYDSYLNATTFSRSKEEGVSNCFQSAGGVGYGLAVKTNRFSGNNGWDIMIVRLDYFGGVVWNKIYRFNMLTNNYPSAVPSKIIAMTDGGFVVVGTTNAFGTQNDIIVLRVNAAGTLMYSFTYGSTNSIEEGNSIIQDDNFLVVAGSQQLPNGNPNALILKIPVAGGAPVWTKIWDNVNMGNEAAFDLVNSNVGAPNGYAITGETLRGANSFDPFLWRTNDDGQIPGMNCQDSIVLQTLTKPHKFDSLVLVRFPVKDCPFQPSVVAPNLVPNTYCLSQAGDSPTGTEEDNINESLSFELKQNFPNPFNPSTTIQFNIPAQSFVTMKIFDVSGKEVMTLVSEQKSAGRYETQFNGETLSSGVYYYKLTAGSYTDIKKMILIK